MEFLHGMLEGMANIEARAYALLSELGADPLTKVTDCLMTPKVTCHHSRCSFVQAHLAALVGSPTWQSQQH